MERKPDRRGNQVAPFAGLQFFAITRFVEIHGRRIAGLDPQRHERQALRARYDGPVGRVVVLVLQRQRLQCIAAAADFSVTRGENLKLRDAVKVRHDRLVRIHVRHRRLRPGRDRS